ncbi:hypothetical protein [Deinococcus humi]|uniref:Uncharacterized protein YifE (UPF0438 family) n=1 Tax=Deinococcus humi TaxID=662880 RepID=A0A7W8JZF4_9DEIO|nr:hypothetical protein [Deinococcus humi]MBB5366067.1 uncharacterized protein YifE (UPF0438 family) [Deinococcus humi]GGO40016.1 hypothetical protein GCM10008949_48950 [Deinococcus humi]
MSDIQLSYARPDVGFFSAGACHILGFAFLERYPQVGFRLRFIRPAPEFRGSHLYVSNGQLAFDAQGYVDEDELLRQHHDALASLQPGWRADVMDVEVCLAEFCAINNHHAPESFPEDVWQRAQRHIAQFPALRRETENYSGENK